MKKRRKKKTSRKSTTRPTSVTPQSVEWMMVTRARRCLWLWISVVVSASGGPFGFPPRGAVVLCTLVGVISASHHSNFPTSESSSAISSSTFFSSWRKGLTRKMIWSANPDPHQESLPQTTNTNQHRLLAWIKLYLSNTTRPTTMAASSSLDSINREVWNGSIAINVTETPSWTNNNQVCTDAKESTSASSTMEQSHHSADDAYPTLHDSHNQRQLHLHEDELPSMAATTATESNTNNTSDILESLQASRSNMWGRTLHRWDTWDEVGRIDVSLRGSIVRGGLPPLTSIRPRRYPHYHCHGSVPRFSPHEAGRQTSLDEFSSSPTSEVQCSLQIDPQSAWGLLRVLGIATGYFGMALLGTLRLLAPLMVARRVLNWCGDVLLDWYRGYYLRTTYRRMEHQYYRLYQGPAIFRSIGRLLAQILLLATLGRIMEWMVGLSHPPCVLYEPPLSSLPIVVPGSTYQSSLGGCHWWCGALWLVAVVGTGHAGAAAIAVWGGPLRIQIRVDPTRNGVGSHGSESHSRPRRPSARRFFARPWRLLKWMRDPDQWIRSIANTPWRYYNPDSTTEPLRPFHPDPFLFPATWEPLRWLLLLGLAREMTASRPTMHALMRQVLIQQSFADEWYRVLMCERRVAIGMLVMVGFLSTSLALLWTVMITAQPRNSLSILLLLPYLFSILISGYMNVFVYHDIRQTKKQQQQVASRPSPTDFWLQGKFVFKSVQW